MRAGRLVSRLALLAALGSPVAAWAQAAPAGPPPAAEAVQAQRPNVLIWMMDDVGFAQLSCFGGLVPTPNIDRVARRGLRYTNYHTPPICSAARAAVLTGRNSHSVNIGGHSAVARPFPGYNGRIPPSAATMAESFRQAGYATFAVGKWDHVPPDEVTPAGPTTYWPLRQGFERFYGFLAAETDNFDPLLWDGNTPRNRPAGEHYHLSADLADQAIAMIGARDAANRRAPFFLYWATGAAHAPHHAPQDWVARFAGKFDMGWDRAREAILARQKALGLVPKDARLSPRPEPVPAWGSVPADEKKLYARQMEVFAAALAHADAQFGRLLDELERRGELDNTIVVVVSDNGASAEGGPTGSYHELLFARGALPSAQENLPFLSRWGGPQTYPHYAMGWAVAGNTPFRNYKQTTYEGGTRVPLVVSWPRGIAAAGEARDQFVHASDIAPTLLAAAGVKPAQVAQDTAQSPFEGRDFRYSFTAKAADGPRSQYFEMFGHKGLWADGWKAVTYSKLETWNMKGAGRIDRPWELYDLRKDPGETTDLARSRPDKLAELDREFDAQARRFNVYPIADQAMMNRELAPLIAQDFARRKGQWRYPGPVARIAGTNVPPIYRGTFTVRARIEADREGATGPVFAHGGRMGGAGFYLSGGRPTFVARAMTGEAVILAADSLLPAGSHELELRVAPAGQEPDLHRVTILADGKEVLAAEARFQIPAGAGDTFEIGRDDGSAVGEGYAPGTDFPGRIREVTFTFPTGR